MRPMHGQAAGPAERSRYWWRRLGATTPKITARSRTVTAVVLESRREGRVRTVPFAAPVDDSEDSEDSDTLGQPNVDLNRDPGIEIS